VKIDCLKDGSERCPLIRLYDFQSDETRSLIKAFKSLAHGAANEISLRAIVPIESIDGTQIIFVRNETGQGVIEKECLRFALVLPAEQWRLNAEIVEPFSNGNFGYQWLAPETSDIQVLLSKSGEW
jgi:hypothetical protein